MAAVQLGSVLELEQGKRDLFKVFDFQLESKTPKLKIDNDTFSCPPDLQGLTVKSLKIKTDSKLETDKNNVLYRYEKRIRINST